MTPPLDPARQRPKPSSLTLRQIGLVLSLTMLFGACTTDTVPLPPAAWHSEGPTLEESLAYASSIYLADVVHTDGVLHWRLREIWRFDPTKGSPPEIGSEILPKRPHLDRPGTSFGDQVVIFHFRPYLQRPNRYPIPEAEASVFGGDVRIFGMSLAHLHTLVTTTPRKLPPAPNAAAAPSS